MIWLIKILNKMIEDKIVPEDRKEAEAFVVFQLEQIDKRIQHENEIENAFRFLHQFNQLEENELQSSMLKKFVTTCNTLIKDIYKSEVKFRSCLQFAVIN
jgi:hypothetical protein